VLGTPTVTIDIVHSPPRVNHRLSFCFFGIVLFAGFFAQICNSQEVAALKGDVQPISLPSAADLLPQTTQGYVRIVDVPMFVERWGQTQLGILGQDDRLKDFWSDQRIEIQKRFSNAGWQLNFQVEDLYDIATGQAALAWIAKPQDQPKPYAIALVLDIVGKKEECGALLARIDKELKTRKAVLRKLEYRSIAINQYTLPRGPGEIIIRESLYAMVGEQLFAADELDTLKFLIDSSAGKSESLLSQLPLFIASNAKLTKKYEGVSDAIDVEYFVRPIGLAKLLRSISGKPVAVQTDALKVLENQGFTKLEAAAGRVYFGSPNFDIFHDAFVIIDPPLPDSVQVLDFPNQAGKQIPAWVGADASNFLSMAWNSKDAFWKVESIVDEMAGQKGVFESVIDGIKIDPVGPQIDIKLQVLPYLTSEIYSVGDTVEPITLESRRSMIAIRINDPQGKLALVLERAMKNEPDAKPEDFREVRIWKVTRAEDGDDLALESDDFGFGNKASKPVAQMEEEKPLLSNWAITIYNPTPDNPANGFLIFASHSEMIKEAIERNAANSNSLFASESDVAPVLAMIEKLNLDNDPSMWQVTRTAKSFKMQYELFRQDKLPQSKSMLATIFDRLIRPKDEVKPVDQKVKGNKLPPFDTISDFLMPGGSRLRTEEQGWSFSGFILAKPKG